MIPTRLLKKPMGAVLGVLMLFHAGCAQEAETPAPTGQVMLAPTQEVSNQMKDVMKAALPDQSATLDIVGVRTGIPMTVNPDGSVTTTVEGIPVGTWTFLIKYQAGGVKVMQASGSQTVVENTTVPVSLTTIDTNFDDDHDGASNLDEVKAGSDPMDPASRPLKVSAVTGGDSHTCARLTDGTVWCWGANYFGQLGNGTTTPGTTPTVTPQKVLDIGPNNPAQSISAGEVHTCALSADRTVWCWGNGSSGQLGNGGIGSSSRPLKVSNLTTATAVSAGGNHTCALLEDATVWCWGNNFRGALGNGSTTNSLIPVKVSNISTATAVISGGSSINGGDHTCARLADGTVWCWGYNANGQLGNGTTNNSLTPSKVSNITSATNALTAGRNHTCALVLIGQNQSPLCWGWNLSGQIGNGFSTQDALIPSTVASIGTALSIAASGSHTCTVLGDGTMRCWGSNFSGELGNGSSTNQPTIRPQKVLEIESAKAATGGSGHTCALLDDGTLRCWGWNLYGQLGNGDTTDQLTPVRVTGLPGSPTSP